MKNLNTQNTYSENFNIAVSVVLDHEGYFSDDLKDAGGATKYGVSLRFARSMGDADNDGFLDMDLNLDGVVDREDIKALTLCDAVRVYHDHFWLKEIAYEKLPVLVAVKLFDLSVNMSQKQANKLLQRALRASTSFSLSDDGIVGAQTLSAIKQANESALLSALCSEAAGFYRLLVAIKPNNKKFLKGWLNRAYFGGEQASFYKYIQNKRNA